MKQEIEVLHKDDLMANAEYVKLASLLVCEYHLQLMEQLQDTNAYRGYLRNGCKLAAGELKRLMKDDLDLICNIDDTLVFNIQTAMEQQITMMATIRPEYIGVLVQMTKRLIENPQEVMEFLNLKMTIDNTQTQAA